MSWTDSSRRSDGHMIVSSLSLSLLLVEDSQDEEDPAGCLKTRTNQDIWRSYQRRSQKLLRNQSDGWRHEAAEI
ncbi:hypothetical protein AMECASPLE_038666 [Ameca splendens]|uniref:Uncharacterized protein n=1 Tax=Ameca splendens TaxID=208324 RepID=A0ABV0Y858_9TELE